MNSTTPRDISGLSPPRYTNVSTGIKSKVENKEQYKQYLDELEPLRKELGVPLKEDLYPESKEGH